MTTRAGGAWEPGLAQSQIHIGGGHLGRENDLVMLAGELSPVPE